MNEIDEIKGRIETIIKTIDREAQFHVGKKNSEFHKGVLMGLEFCANLIERDLLNKC